MSSRTFCEGWLGLGEGLTLVTGGSQSASPTLLLSALRKCERPRLLSSEYSRY